MEFFLYLLFSILFTWGLGLLPPYIIRYKVVKKPLRRRYAALLAYVFFNMQMLLNVYIRELMGAAESRHTALILVSAVSYYIMSKSKRKDD